MPTQDNSRGVFGIPQPQRAPDGGGFRGFVRRFGRGFVRGAVPDNPVQGATAALGGPGTVVGRGLGTAVRESIGGSTWFNNLQDRARDMFTRDRNESPASRTPTFMSRQPSAPPPPSGAAFGPPSNLTSYNHMPDPNAGPPGPPPVRAFPLPNAAPPPTRGQRMGNNVLATGDAAVDFARGVGQSRSGLGASSYGRDQLMSTYRAA
jgi:hypothetical protein